MFNRWRKKNRNARKGFNAELRVVNENNNNIFENNVNDLLDEGYEVLSSSCGVTTYDCEYYIAVLYRNPKSWQKYFQTISE